MLLKQIKFIYSVEGACRYLSRVVCTFLVADLKTKVSIALRASKCELASC